MIIIGIGIGMGSFSLFVVRFIVPLVFFNNYCVSSLVPPRATVQLANDLTHVSHWCIAAVVIVSLCGGRNCYLRFVKKSFRQDGLVGAVVVW